MELIDRYVQAVGTYLPRAQRSDIVDELSEDLRCEVDDRQRSLGRSLTESEEEAMLLQRGHPMTVAGAYLPQRSLIGPALLPAYTFVLKLVIAVFAVIFMLIVGPIRIGEGAGTLEAIATSAMNLWIYVWIPIGIVTVVFAAVERAQQRDAGYGWNPRSLPGPRNVSLIPRSESIAQAAFGTIFILWWASGAPMLPAGDAGSIQHTMLRLFVPVLFVALCSVALGVANALHPYWSRLRLALRVGIDGLTAAIALWIVASSWTGILADAARLNHPQLLSAAQWTNLGLALGLAVTAAIAAVTCVAYAVRLARYSVGGAATGGV